MLNVVFFLLGDSSASEFYAPTFRNSLSHLHRWCKQEEHVSAEPKPKYVLLNEIVISCVQTVIKLSALIQ